jgi:hypothetical protein
VSQMALNVTDLESARTWCRANGIVMEIRSGESPNWRVWLNSNWGHARSDDLIAAVRSACMEAKEKLDAFGEVNHV